MTYSCKAALVLLMRLTFANESEPVSLKQCGRSLLRTNMYETGSTLGYTVDHIKPHYEYLPMQ